MLADVDDEDLMSAEQQDLLRTVVDAINRGVDIYGAVRERVSPVPDKRDMATLLRILRLPEVGFRHGEPPDVVVARIMDLLEARAEGDEIRPMPESDSRY